MTHLGDRISALVDGELGHDARERALAHVAHCPPCREALERERSVKGLLAATAGPAPSTQMLASLSSMSVSGGPLPPRARQMPQSPVVPLLPTPGRLGRGARRPGGRTDSPGPAYTSRRARRVRVAAAGALSVGLLLSTAFAAGGSRPTDPPVVPPAAELSVEHTATTTSVTVGNPGLGVAVGFGSTGPNTSRGR